MTKQNTKNNFNKLTKRILFVIISVIVFRIGSFIPIPGINTAVLSKLLDEHHGTLLEMFNMFSGGALRRASIFALGIMPYISSSIIIQLLTLVNPYLIEIKKEGEVGSHKIDQYTRYFTLVLATFQSIGIVTALPHISAIQSIIINPNYIFYITAIVSLVTGTIFLMWLGEQITDNGLGNGISIIIFTGIVAGLLPAIIHTIEQIREGDLPLIYLFFIISLIFMVIFLVVFIESAQRRIGVNYAKYQHGRIYHMQTTTHLPLKINMSGVIPAIFASSVILFPVTISSWFAASKGFNWLIKVALYLQPGKFSYLIIHSTAIIFFCFFYTILIFNPRETAETLKKSGAFIPGIRPGEHTSKYISKVMQRLTLIGALYITFICLIPEIMHSTMKVPFYFGGTSLLIVVVVIMDFISQVQTFIMSTQYESILKKANLKNFTH